MECKAVFDKMKSLIECMPNPKYPYNAARVQNNATQQMLDKIYESLKEQMNEDRVLKNIAILKEEPLEKIIKRANDLERLYNKFNAEEDFLREKGYELKIIEPKKKA